METNKRGNPQNDRVEDGERKAKPQYGGCMVSYQGEARSKVAKLTTTGLIAMKRKC